MRTLNRRDLMVSLAAYATLGGSRGEAAACDVSRSRGQGFSTKSYRCDLGDDKKLTTTFLRVSDVLFESAGRTPLPGEFGNYQNLVKGHKIIETPALKSFEDLMAKHSFAFEPNGVFLQFDGRSSDQQVAKRDYLTTSPGRWRTLGVWDEPEPDDWPLFPLPSELRKAMRSKGAWDQKFLRYANPSDFSELDVKTKEYLALWGSRPNENIDLRALGNLKLLEYINAGSVDEFLPLLFNSYVGSEGCTGEPSGGAHYMPPALYLDVAVCKNDGVSEVQIDDFYGVENKQTSLRPYSSRTPDGEAPFRWTQTTLQPGESVLIVQRLLFGVIPFSLTDQTGRPGKEIRPKRAEYGQSHLPKGVVIDGTPVAFDGRSHNALIIGSYYEKGSCPYLSSWCETNNEWVLLGKILTECVGAEQIGVEMRRFTGLRNRFKIVEREHERSTLFSIILKLILDDGKEVMLSHPMKTTVLNIGEEIEVEFDLPSNFSVNKIRATELSVKGFYDKLTQADLEECAKLLELTG